MNVISHHVHETRIIGDSLGKLLESGDIICLKGDLGSGKTSLTQGIGKGLQITETINSPTFVFIREYQPQNRKLYLYHVDLYRIDNPLDVISLGLTDYMYGDGVTVIEWAERACELMPASRLWIEIELLSDTKRRLTFRAAGERYVLLLGKLRQALVDRDIRITDTTEA